MQILHNRQIKTRIAPKTNLMSKLEPKSYFAWNLGTDLFLKTLFHILLINISLGYTK
jgi:hypothetical protein